MLVRRCKEAGIQYFHPHTFRHALAAEIAKEDLTEEEKKAFSQNFGHENINMTFGTDGYGRIPENRQIEILKQFNLKRSGLTVSARLHPDDINLIAKKVAEELSNGA